MTTKAPELTEAEWQRQVTDLAASYGWQHVHFRPAQTSKGWRTPVSGPLGAGWPDLVLVRERVIFVELKARRGRLSEDQQRVRDILRTASAEWYVWWPADFDEAHAVLRERDPFHTSSGPATALPVPGPDHGGNR